MDKEGSDIQELLRLPLEVDKFDLSNHAGHKALSDLLRMLTFGPGSFPRPAEVQALEEELSVEMKVHNPEKNNTI